eukprot:gene12515-8948_t
MKKRGNTKQTGRGSSAPSEQEAVHSTTSESVERIQGVLKTLESKAIAGESIQSELDFLLTAYREISIKNKVESKRDEYLQQEILDLQQKNSDASQEVVSLRQDYRTIESKVEKLENLSRMLSNRVKSVESKANEDVKAEKEDRLKLSYEFSAKIKDISAKLDDLSKRREAVISENARLKDILRECFEQFDNDPSLQSGDNDPFDTSVTDADYDSDKDLDSDQRAEKKERKAMEDQEDQTKLKALKEQEEFLKAKSAKFMDVFDSFQQRLTESNQLFKLKQGRAEEIAKDIQAVEKQNNELTARIAGCTVSAKTLSDTIDKLREEKERYGKLIEKQKALIEKFQEDISSLEAAR